MTMIKRIATQAAMLMIVAAWARPALAQATPGERPAGEARSMEEPATRPALAAPKAPKLVMPALRAQEQGALAYPSIAGVGALPSLRLTGVPMLTVSGSALSPSGKDETPLQVVGTVLLGLGASSLFASGVVWLVAANAATRLDDECPNHQCVEGTLGGDAYETTRDGLKAADILAGVGFPVMGVGAVLLIFSGALGPRYGALRSGPTFMAGPGRANLAVRF